MHRSFTRAIRSSGHALALLVAWSLVGSPASVAAQECAAFDADGNGTVTSADAAPLSLEFELGRSCLGTDFGAALACRGRDVDRSGGVDGEDLRHFDDVALAPLTLCWNAPVSTRSECAPFDLDRDGWIGPADAAPLIAFRDAIGQCLGVDLASLACAPADLDGDTAVSVADLSLVLDRFDAFEACFARASSEGTTRRALWIDRDRLLSLPTEGAAWERLYREATDPTSTPRLSDPLDRADTRALAQALVGVRLGDPAFLDAVRRTLARLVSEESEAGADALAVARNLVGYVLAADLIELGRLDPALDGAFRARLSALRDRDLRGRTLRSTHAERPNNWGTHAGASRVAIALYLGDDADLADAARVHRAWLGDPAASNAAFRFGDRSWQADPTRPVGVNPRGARIAGVDVDGALPEEMRRGGAFADPPARTGYAWEALQGATVTTELLARHGHPDAWRWGDDALARAATYLARLDARFGGWSATGDDRWNVWLINRATGLDLPTEAGVSVGKNMGFTDWTHAD
ncbi:MAG: alginate lyase family protein [Myxococcota bacterium]